MIIILTHEMEFNNDEYELLIILAIIILELLPFDQTKTAINEFYDDEIELARLKLFLLRLFSYIIIKQLRTLRYKISQ